MKRKSIPDVIVKVNKLCFETKIVVNCKMNYSSTAIIWRKQDLSKSDILIRLLVAERITPLANLFARRTNTKQMKDSLHLFH